jgi:hypothetical protein
MPQYYLGKNWNRARLLTDRTSCSVSVSGFGLGEVGAVEDDEDDRIGEEGAGDDGGRGIDSGSTGESGLSETEIFAFC